MRIFAILLLLLIVGIATWLVVGRPTTAVAAPAPTPASPPETRDAGTLLTGPADAGILVIRHPRGESDNDQRDVYHLALLREALDRTSGTYGPYRLEPGPEVMNELLIMRKLEAGSPDIDLMVRPTSQVDEARLEPIRIPLEKGLLGYRICLIQAQDQARFSAIDGPAALSAVRLGQGRDWNDVSIYEANRMTVVTGANYEGLFEMLLRQRFDAFPRGVNEVFAEHAARVASMPDLAIEKDLVIHYPFCRYAWVGKGPKGDQVRKRLTEGLEGMIQDGTFDRLFYRHHGQDIVRAELHRRRIIPLSNPHLPATAPLARRELWFDPARPVPP